MPGKTARAARPSSWSSGPACGLLCGHRLWHAYAGAEAKQPRVYVAGEVSAAGVGAAGSPEQAGLMPEAGVLAHALPSLFPSAVPTGSPSERFA